MVGYPGAGKTTTSRIIHDLTGAEHLWADRIRNRLFPNPTHSTEENSELYDYMNKMTGDLLAAGKSVIFDTGFNFYKDRLYLHAIADDCGAQTVVVWVQADKSLAKRRATDESHAERNTYPETMTEEIFERIAGGLEIPRPEEPLVVIDGAKISHQYVRERLGLEVA